MSVTSRPSLRRAATLSAAGLLLGAAGTGTASAATDDDFDGEAAGAWLAEQLDDGVVYNAEFDFDDIGLTLDVLVALNGLGGFDDDVTQIVDAVEGGLDGYIGFGDDVFAGPVAKAAVVWRSVGEDPRDAGGIDLVEILESTVTQDDSDADGRIADQTESGEDYANVIGQAHAAQALHEAESPLTGDALDHLLFQQCADGFFRLYFDAGDAGQSCDDADEAEPNPDATAQAVLALRAVGTDTAREAADRATAWLVEVQGADGSFDGGAELPEANANSTGLAARALAASDESDAAADATAWLASVQVSGDGEDAGAVALNDVDFAAASDGSVPEEARDTWIRATADAALAQSSTESEGATDGADGSVSPWLIGAITVVIVGGLVLVVVWWRARTRTS